MTNKLKYFIGNWKMFGDFSDYKIIYKINQFNNRSKNILKEKKIVLCVPSTLIHYFKNKLTKKSIFLGVQNCHHHQKYGPFTGALSATMLKKAGAEFIILGHSENRFSGDTNNLLNKKISYSLNEKLKVIYCIGETFKEKRSKKTFHVLKNQIKKCLKQSYNPSNILIAYEPVWAIGTNKIPKKNELEKTIKFIKNHTTKIFKRKKPPKVLYGGSVNDRNIRQFKSISLIDGFLIGGASHSPKKFIDIIKNYYK